MSHDQRTSPDDIKTLVTDLMNRGPLEEIEDALCMDVINELKARPLEGLAAVLLLAAMMDG